MKKEEFLKREKELQEQLNVWQLEVGVETFADFTIGCFFDSEEKKWIVYVNSERGQHSTLLETESEEEAFDELLSVVEVRIETDKYM